MEYGFIESILKSIFTENGLYAFLFVSLLVWILKTNNDRERRYIDTINNLTEKVSDKISKIENDVEDIKDAITSKISKG